ncbi:unnamed protein product [Prunus armeniaca]
MDENRWKVFSQSNAKISKDVRLTLEEPEPGLTVMNSTSWMSMMESRLDEQPPLREKDDCVEEREVHEGERRAEEIERRELEREVNF